MKCLEDKEKCINVMLDKIYIKPTISYKGGKIEEFGKGVDGVSCGEVATTVQTFMLTSIMSKNKDVVGLYPNKNLKAEHLRDLFVQVIKALTIAGYIIITKISDNNRVNKKNFDLLCNGVTTSYISNPFNQNNKIFLLFDTVHIFKSIRNN